MVNLWFTTDEKNLRPAGEISDSLFSKIKNKYKGNTIVFNSDGFDVFLWKPENEFIWDADMYGVKLYLSNFLFEVGRNAK